MAKIMSNLFSANESHNELKFLFGIFPIASMSFSVNIKQESSSSILVTVYRCAMSFVESKNWIFVRHHKLNVLFLTELSVQYLSPR